MTFKLPENLSEIETEKLDELLTQAGDAASALLDKDEAELTDDEIAELESLAKAAESIEAEQTGRAAAAEERTAKVSAIKDRFKKPASEDESKDEAPAAETDEEDVDKAAAAEVEELAVEETEVPAEEITVPDDASELVEEEALTASAKRAATLAAAKNKVPVAKAPAQKEDKMTGFSLIAAGDVPGISAGSAFTDFDHVVDAFGQKLQAFVEGSGSATFTQRYPIAKMRRETDPELTIKAGASHEEAAEVLKFATSESRLSGGSLVASGGWAAPSQIIYDIPIVEEAPDGILDLPSITVERGGFQHTLGIDFSTAIYGNANFGFTQTETQAAAKTVKPFFEPTDPTFQDERLQVIGYGMRAGFLTLQGYPELIKRMASGSVTAFAHYKNKDRINRLLSYFTAPSGTQATIGSLTHSILDSLSFNRRRLVHKFFLRETATFQAMAPFWLLDVMREDLAKRSGWDALKVDDGYIKGLFAQRGINIQFVRDWTAQDLGPAATAYPATAEIALWYAGTFVAASGNVVSFDALYDYDGISKNTYTAFFNEESVLVARMNPVDALRFTFDTALINREGRTGKDDLGFTGTGRIAA